MDAARLDAAAQRDAATEARITSSAEQRSRVALERQQQQRQESIERYVSAVCRLLGQPVCALDALVDTLQSWLRAQEAADAEQRAYCQELTLRMRRLQQQLRAREEDMAAMAAELDRNTGTAEVVADLQRSDWLQGKVVTHTHTLSLILSIYLSIYLSINQSIYLSFTFYKRAIKTSNKASEHIFFSSFFFFFIRANLSLLLSFPFFFLLCSRCSSSFVAG